MSLNGFQEPEKSFTVVGWKVDVIISPSSGSELVDVPLGVLDLVTPRDVVVALPGQLAVGVATDGVTMVPG